MSKDFAQNLIEAIFRGQLEDNKPFEYAVQCVLSEQRKGASCLAVYTTAQIREIGWPVYNPPVEFAESEHTQLLPYPIEVWEDTIYYEFAERCTTDNNIPKEMFIEALKTMVGAVVANRVKGNKEGMSLRQYTIFVLPPGSGKDTAISRAKNLLKCVFDEYDFDGNNLNHTAFLCSNKKPGYDNVGATVVSAASENALIDAAKLCPRVLWEPAELGTLFSKGNESYGRPMMDVLRRCYDYSDPQFTTSEKRKSVPDLMYLSFQSTIQPDALDNLQQGTGLPSRVTWMTPPPFKKVASLGLPVLGDLPARLFTKLSELEKLPHDIIKVDPDANTLLEEWYGHVQEREYSNDEVFTRVNGMVLRNALHLAWITGRKTITPEMIESTIKLGEWQLSVRAGLFTPDARNDQALIENKLMCVVEQKAGTRGMSAREIDRSTHASQRFGAFMFQRALTSLVKLGKLQIGPHPTRRGVEVYGIPPKGDEQ